MRPTGKWRVPSGVRARELIELEGSQNGVGRVTEWRWKRDGILQYNVIALTHRNSKFTSPLSPAI
eukprot:scaffold47322_cov68-Cyclotella_meneghiniana.AAC.4